MEANPKQIPEELLPIAGRLLRQARTCRRLTVTQAADRMGVPVEQLEGLEEGAIPTTTEYIQFLIVHYGWARAGAVEDLIIQIMMEKSRCKSQTEKRMHLSLVGDDPKPWERNDFSCISKRISGLRQF